MPLDILMLKVRNLHCSDIMTITRRIDKEEMKERPVLEPVVPVHPAKQQRVGSCWPPTASLSFENLEPRAPVTTQLPDDLASPERSGFISIMSFTRVFCG